MDFIKELDSDKIKLNRPTRIEMSKFLSFLTVETYRPTGNWAGKDNGWTKVMGDNGLEITGGIVNGVEYLDSIQYGSNLQNPYNNYVNPIYLLMLMNDDGKKYFLKMYKEDIKKILEKYRYAVTLAQDKVSEIENFLYVLKVEEV